jgi:hypothetical protein
MARPRFEPLLTALALFPAACDGGGDKESRNSITVELPPAHPAVAAPGFSLESPGRQVQPGNERQSKAVQELAARRF